MITIIVGIIALIVCAYKSVKIEILKEQLEIKISENLSLKRVMYENNLIPERFVK